MTKLEAGLENIICECIQEHKAIWFYYESNSGKYRRKVNRIFLLLKIMVMEIYFLPVMHILQKKQSNKTGTTIKVSIYSTRLIYINLKF